jgi:hypothetical protein
MDFAALIQVDFEGKISNNIQELIRKKNKKR